MARKSSFAESVINGTYGNDEKKKNTQQPMKTQQVEQTNTTVKQPTVKSSFADSVINGTYKDTTIPLSKLKGVGEVSDKTKNMTNNDITPQILASHNALSERVPEQDKRMKEALDKMVEDDSGYHFGDITKFLVNGAIDLGGKTIGTVADIGGNILHGGMQALEGGADALTYLGADINDLFGRSEEAEKLRQNARFNSTGAIFGTNKPNETIVQQNVLEELDKHSWAPEIVDDLANGVGGVGMNAALATMSGGSTLATNVSIFATSYGDAMSDALNNGASVSDARLWALIDASASTLAENAFNNKFGMNTKGFAGKYLKGKFGNALDNVIKSKPGKVLFNVLKDSLEEGSEEVIETMVGNFTKSLAYNITDLLSNVNPDIKFEYGRDEVSKDMIGEFFKPLTQKETLERFIMASLTSAVYNVGAGAITNAFGNNQQMAQEPIQEATQQPIETPQIQTNQENIINNQPVIEQPQIEPKIAENEAIREVEQQSIENDSNAFNLGKNEQVVEQQKQQPTQNKQMSLELNEQEQTQNKNENIPEVKSEDVIKATNKETSKNIADNLTKAIEGRNDSQNIKEIVRNVEQETGKKMRSWVETSTTSTGTTELVNSMNKEKITYEPTSNKKNLDAASKELAGMTYEQQLEKAKSIVNGNNRLNATDIAVLEKVTQEALKNGKMNDFMDLVQETAILGTESGQVVQALSLIRQSDPTTQLSTLQKLIEREQSKGNKIYDGVKINQDLVENVLNSYNEDGTWNQEKFDNAMYELKQDIVNQMKVRPSEKFTAWRYLSMLGNPKTHFRNIVANIAMNKLQGAKNKIAAGIETITPMSKLNKALGGSEETAKGHTLRKSTQEIKDFANETVEKYFKENKQSNKYNDNVKSLKSELEQGRKIFKERTKIGEALNWAEKKNTDLLDKEDVKFNKSTAKKAFAEFLTANGLETQQDIEAYPDLVNQGLDYALFKGNEVTFHQHSQTGTALRNFRESLRQGSNLSRTIGLGMDATLPFINTPINIAKTGIEYTPGIGLIKTISDVQKAPKNLKADAFVDSISKQFAGGMLAAVGYELAKQGILNGKSGADKKDKLEQNLGKQGYSLNLFGQTFDLSWLSPSAMPMFVGVETYNATKGNSNFSPEMIMDILANTIDPLSEMSVISSVTDSLKSYSQGTQALGDIASSALTSYISQYVPTLSGQVATVFDDTQRSSSGNSLGEKILNQVKYKIPGLRNTLPAQVDVWGEEKKYASNPLIRAAEAFLSPANRKEVKIDDTTKEIERVYDSTGSGLPSLSLTKSPKIDAEYYNLNSEEYTQYKKDYGKTAKSMLDELMQQENYKKADDVEKEKMISQIYKYATYIAKKRIADDNNLKFEYKKSSGKGYNYPKYYLSLSKDDFDDYISDKYVDYNE